MFLLTLFIYLFIDFNITEINYYDCSLASLEQHMQIQNEFLCQYFFTFNILSFLCYFCLVNILSIKKFRNIFFVTNFKSQYLRFFKQSLKFCKFIYFYFTYFFTKVVQFIFSNLFKFIFCSTFQYFSHFHKLSNHFTKIFT